MYEKLESSIITLPTDIYGDDTEIITLSSGDFATSVDNRGDNVWFINFYSPRCSHCHELAPAVSIEHCSCSCSCF